MQAQVTSRKLLLLKYTSFRTYSYLSFTISAEVFFSRGLDPGVGIGNQDSSSKISKRPCTQLGTVR